MTDWLPDGLCAACHRLGSFAACLFLSHHWLVVPLGSCHVSTPPRLSGFCRVMANQPVMELTLDSKRNRMKVAVCFVIWVCLTYLLLRPVLGPGEREAKLS